MNRSAVLAFHDFLWTATASSLEYLNFLVQAEIAFSIAFLLPHCTFLPARHARIGNQMHNRILFGIDEHAWWRFLCFLCMSSIIDKSSQTFRSARFDFR
jgi:uncharacterized membrane protein